MQLVQLNENVITPSNMDTKQLVSFIQQRCKPWLQESEQGTLIAYRGLVDVHSKKDAFTAATLNVKKNRKPRNSRPFENSVMQYLIQLANKTANRQNSAFITGNERSAEQYGVPYVFLAIGEFKYTWSTSMSDWWKTFHVKDEIIAGTDRYNMYKQIFDWTIPLVRKVFDRNEREAKEYVESMYNITSDNPIFQEIVDRHAITDSIHEIVTSKTTPYRAIDVIDPAELIELFGSSIKGDDNTLDRAIKLGNEIMVKCDKFLAVEANVYKDIVRPLLN